MSRKAGSICRKTGSGKGLQLLQRAGKQEKQKHLVVSRSSGNGRSPGITEITTLLSLERLRAEGG